MHQSRRTYVPLFPPTARKYIFQSHQSPSGPVYTKKTPQVFWIHKTVWFEHEDTFISKLPGEKGYLVRIPSRTDLRRYIVYQSRLPPCLAANKNLTMTTSTSGMYLSRRTYVPLFLQTVKKYIHISVPPVPFWSCLHQKNTTSFSGLTIRFDLNMKIHFKTTRRKTLRIQASSRTNLRRY